MNTFLPSEYFINFGIGYLFYIFYPIFSGNLCHLSSSIYNIFTRDTYNKLRNSTCIQNDFSEKSKCVILFVDNQHVVRSYYLSHDPLVFGRSIAGRSTFVDYLSM